MGTERTDRFGFGGLHNSVVGDILDSTDATDELDITHMIHPISGAGEIVTLNPPWDNFSGFIILLPAGACTFTNADNIACAITCAANLALLLVYNPATKKWWPCQGLTAS